MIQALLFDLDNTLYSYDEAHEAAFRTLTAWAREHLGLEDGDFVRLHREANRTLKARCGGGSATLRGEEGLPGDDLPRNLRAVVDEERRTRAHKDV